MIINFFVFLRQEQNIIFSKKRERDIHRETYRIKKVWRFETYTKVKILELNSCPITITYNKYVSEIQFS